MTELLLRLDLLRLGESLRHPTAAWLGIGLPLALLLGLLWGIGGTAAPETAGVAGAATIGFVVAGPVSFAAYGTLFRGVDDAFLRRLGIPPADLYRERALRLLGIALAVALLSVVPLLSAGLPVGRPLAVALAAGVAGWGSAALALAGAARMVAGHAPGKSWGALAVGMWDQELAAIAPLVHAPLFPLFAGAAAGAWTGSAEGGAAVRALLVAAGSLLAGAAAAPLYARALPRFGARALEMTFVDPPGGEGELVVHTGVSRLLPRRVAAVWARDAVVAGRRFAWAARLSWPVAIGAVVGLARWGESPATRGWIAVAALLTLLAQAAAGVGLGRLERRRTRWIDRSVGIGWGARLLGRWTWGVGLSLWLTVPLALAWGWWSGAGAGWPWVAAGVVTAGGAAVASLASSGWR